MGGAQTTNPTSSGTDTLTDLTAALLAPLLNFEGQRKVTKTHKNISFFVTLQTIYGGRKLPRKQP